MNFFKMAHQHKYDKNGRQFCCTQEEKINLKADEKLIQEQGDKACCVVDEKTRQRHFKGDGHNHGIDLKRNWTTIVILTTMDTTIQRVVIALSKCFCRP